MRRASESAWDICENNTARCRVAVAEVVVRAPFRAMIGGDVIWSRRSKWAEKGTGSTPCPYEVRQQCDSARKGICVQEPSGSRKTFWRPAYARGRGCWALTPPCMGCWALAPSPVVCWAPAPPPAWRRPGAEAYHARKRGPLPERGRRTPRPAEAATGPPIGNCAAPPMLVRRRRSAPGAHAHLATEDAAPCMSRHHAAHARTPAAHLFG